MTEVVEGSTGSTLTVTKAGDNDGGFYQCSAKSDEGQLFSDVAEVTIHCETE